MAEIHLNVSSFNEYSSPLFARTALIALSIFTIEYNLIVVRFKAPLLRISLICAFRIFSRFRTAFDGRRSTQAWLQNLAPFQVFINTSVIQDKTLTIYINFGKFKLEKAPNFVTRPASNVDRRTPFGSEKKFGMHISVKCVVNV